MKDLKSAAKFAAKLKKTDCTEYRSIPFWSWNDKLDKDVLTEQIRWMKSQDFGGFFMHARGGLKTAYLSDEWFECVEACADEAKKQKMECWAYDENGWPSGFVGGKLLEDPENRDEFLTTSKGKLDKKATVSYKLGETTLIRVPADSVAEEGAEYLNVYEHKSNSTADILNPEVVNKFIDATHNEYKKRLGKKFNRELKGFFTDEPQYYRWGHPFTKVLKVYFKDKFGEDIFDGLGLMFVEKEGYRAFRYKYWKAMQELMLNNYSKNVYNWCKNNGVGFTGHYIEESRLDTQMWCCGGIMPFYEYETIPGMDLLCRRVTDAIDPRQVASVARQLGKKRVLTETFALCGWDVTPRTLKVIGESQYVCGINLMCQHLLPVSEYGQRKRDYPAHFSAVNPWVKEDFKSFNDYFAKLGYLLGESEEAVSVALFCPIRSLYFDYKREPEKDYGDTAYESDKSYLAVAEKLAAMNVPYHIIDETIMQKHGRTKNGKLIVGECSYDYIVFPKTITMDASSAKLFDAFYACGGKMLFTDGVPEYVEGEPHEYVLKSNVSFEEIAKAQKYTVNDYATGIRSTMRKFKGNEYVFAVNTDMEKGYTLTFGGEFENLLKLDLETFEITPVGKTVEFKAGESHVLLVSEEKTAVSSPKKEFTFSDGYKVVSSTDNYLTLDKVRFSLDGKTYSDKLSYMGVFNELLNARAKGDVYLKYEFNVKTAPKKISFLTEDMNIKEFYVNGVKAEFSGRSEVEKQILTADVCNLIKEGANEVVLKIDFYESDKVYYVLFSADDTESLKNCLTYDTTIEASYLKGDFGVFSEKGFKKGKEKNVLLAEDDFYIDKKKSDITDTVSEGYPFFSGKMTFNKEFTSDGEPAILKLSGNFCLCDLKINGVQVVKSYFADRIDVSDYIVKGTNTAEITLVSGNRNLLGPHHLKESEEPLVVGVDTFELVGSWVKGVSKLERKNYSFVKFGLFN